MKILSGNRRIIDLVGLNAVPPNVEDIRTRIQQIIARLVIVAALTLCVAGQIVDITKLVKKDFVVVLSRIYLALTFGCMLVIYLRLIGLTKQTNDLIDYLENVVNNRRLSLAIFKELFSLFELLNSTLLVILGCEQDEKVILMYSNQDVINWRYMKIGISGFGFQIAFGLLTAATIQISNYIFNWPSPEISQLPLDLS